MSGAKRNDHWKDLAAGLLTSAKAAKAGLEVRFYESGNLSVKVRKGDVEEIRRTGPFGAGMRVFKDGRSVSAATAKTDPDNLGKVLDRLLDNVTLVDQDPANGLPEAELLYKGDGPDLQLHDAAARGLTIETATEMAKACEQAAFDANPAIKNSSGAGVGVGYGRGWIFNTGGLEASEAMSSVSVWASPVAEDDQGNTKSESGGHGAHHLADLEDATQVGRIAGERAARMLGSVKGPTGKYPILFTPDTSKALVSTLFESISGTSVYRKSTFLGDMEGKRIGSDLVTIIDDPHRVRGQSSRLFDGEGVACKPSTLVGGGMLNYFPCDTFSARKLDRKSTGHSSRGLAGTGGVGSSNLYLAAGEKSPEQLMKEMGEGLLVTSFIGFGFNMATGDFSRGVEGFWIKDGKLDHPVHEITVSDNLGAMFEEIIGVGNDLEFRHGTDAPSLLIKEMTVSGS